MINSEQFLILTLGIWGSAICAPLLRLPDGIRRLLGALMPLAYSGLLFAFPEKFSTAQKFLLSTFLLLQIIKSAYLLTIERARLKSIEFKILALYFSVWPAFDLERLQAKKDSPQRLGSEFVKGYVIAWCGAALIVFISVLTLRIDFAGWMGILAFLLAIHFGLSRMLYSGLSMIGINGYPLFNNPVSSDSLQDFWSKRWNTPFVEMNKLYFMPLVRNRFPRGLTVFLIFLLSGLLHEVGISYAVNSGWGLPTLYFVIQGLAFLIEKKFLSTSDRWLKRLWAWLVVLLPLPLLFHHEFREHIIGSALTYLHEFLNSKDVSWYWDKVLWMASAGHFLVLAASFQVPKKLNWSGELARLSPLNRKLMWTYGAFIVFVIVSMGTMGLYLHHEIMDGEKGSIALVAFTALFWLARILTDALYFKHSDWPSGDEFVVGHALLNTLFLFLILSHGAIVWTHAF